MKTCVQRFATMAEVKFGMADKCREIYAKLSLEIVKVMKAAHLNNVTIYLKKITDPDDFVLFNYVEYNGSDFQADMTKLAARNAYARWRKDCDACFVAVANLSCPVWAELELLFFTAGAADIVPTPAKYTRICMIIGPKLGKKMEYRALHANTRPGVLKVIKDGNVRNFRIHLGEVGGKLYLVSYVEYACVCSAADDAKVKALPANHRWWKLTEACQEPLPEAAARN